MLEIDHEGYEYQDYHTVTFAFREDDEKKDRDD